MLSHPPTSPVAPTRIDGAVPLGLTKKVTDQIVKGIRRQFNEAGRSVAVKALQFSPSTRTTTETGSFQVLANTIVEVLNATGSQPRIEAMDSVVTVGRGAGGQKLEALAIPRLQRVAA
jgi:hypothetical protein